MIDHAYQVPVAACETSIEIKKSRFIACLAPAQSREQALAQLADRRERFPDARHHCWAYQIGPPQQPGTIAMSDDGEPSGTAGKPILNVLQNKAIGDAMLIVTRYFGGIKLGAGGLVRAYASAAQAVFECAELTDREPLTELQIACTFKDEPTIRRWLDAHQGIIRNVTYHEGVVLAVTILQKDRRALIASLANLKYASLLEQENDTNALD